MPTPDATWDLPRHLLAAFPAGDDPAAAAAEWARRLLAAGTPPPREEWPAVLVVVSPPREPAARAGVALALAWHLARDGRSVVVVDGDDRRPGMTAWLGREGREGWIDVARHGISPAVAGVVPDGGEGRIRLLGVGSYAPVRLEDAEIAPLLARLREDAGHVIVAVPAGDPALPWLADPDTGLVLCRGAAGDWDWEPPAAPLLTVVPQGDATEAGAAAPGPAATRTAAGEPPRGSSPVFRRLALLLALLLAVSAAWWLLVLRNGEVPPPGEREVAVLAPASAGSTTGTATDTGTAPAGTLAVAASPADRDTATAPSEGAAVAGSPPVAAAPDTAGGTAGDPFRLPVGRDGYCLHVESVSDSLGAERALAELARRYGIRGTIRRTWVNGRWWWRIYTGSFGSLAEARAWSDTLKRRLHTDYALPVSSRHLR